MNLSDYRENELKDKDFLFGIVLTIFFKWNE